MGQFGNGTTTNAATAISINTVSDIQALATGYGFSRAVVVGGAVKCWGNNLYGGLGVAPRQQRIANRPRSRGLKPMRQLRT